MPDVAEASPEVSNKRVKLNDHSYIKVSKLVMNVKRGTNNNKLGSQIIQYPLFESNSNVQRYYYFYFKLYISYLFG